MRLQSGVDVSSNNVGKRQATRVSFSNVSERTILKCVGSVVMWSYGVTANNTGACAYIILQSFLCTKGPSADEIALERSSEGAQFVEEKG